MESPLVCCLAGPSKAFARDTVSQLGVVARAAFIGLLPRAVLSKATRALRPSTHPPPG